MAPRAIWRGAIAFGMVAIPIRLYPATESKDVSFVTLHSTCHSRLRQRRYCPHHDTHVEFSEVTRGYEYSKDQYVVMEPSDFEDLPVSSKHTVEIKQFVDLASIDPVYFERSYLLEPEAVGEKPFYLLKRALEVTGRVAIAKVSLRQKEHLSCLRPYENGIIMATMYYPDEIRGNSELNLPEEEPLVSDQEIEMATTLIGQLTGTFEPEEHDDEYRTALLQAIEARLGISEPVAAAPVPVLGKVGDLMEALRASIEATKQAAAETEVGAQPAKSRSSARSRKKAAVPSGE